MSTITETPTDALTNARRALSALESDAQGIDAAYRTAHSTGDAAGMKAARQRRADLDDEIHAARVNLARAEEAAATSEIASAQAALAKADADVDTSRAAAVEIAELQEQANTVAGRAVTAHHFAEITLNAAKQRRMAARQRLAGLTKA